MLTGSNDPWFYRKTGARSQDGKFRNDQTRSRMPNVTYGIYIMQDGLKKVAQASVL